MKNIIKAIVNFVLHHGEKSYKLFGEYCDGFTGTIIYKGDGDANVRNAKVLFRGDFVILVSNWNSEEHGIKMQHERLTINCNAIEKILN